MKPSFGRLRQLGLVLALGLGAAPVASTLAEPPQALRDAAQLAISTSPEVQAQWRAFTAAREEQEAARGGFRPEVNLTANVGHERRTRPGTPTDSYSTRGLTLSLEQMLYDGMFTRNEVSRLGYAGLVRYYELLDAAEAAVLEAARAYADVVRYRQLVLFAQDNYVQHRLIYDQIAERVAAGVGRRVDLETATGRLALAESNLITELSNLHDVSARYQRVVGLPAPAELPMLPESWATLPSTAQEALAIALPSNPAINAALENARAAKALIETRRAAFRPQVDFRARQSINGNFEGRDGTSRDQVVEVVLSYNLYRGNSDEARLRQAAEQAYQARDLQEKACRDVRQTVAIAFNDVQRLEQQKIFLDQHMLSTEKAREAFKAQFDIGQRTLLDLLDTENEYFDARRSFVNAQIDHQLAQARTLASMAQLSSALGVVRDGVPTAAEAGQDRDGMAPEDLCPIEAPTTLEIDRDRLYEEARRALGR